MDDRFKNDIQEDLLPESVKLNYLRKEMYFFQLFIMLSIKPVKKTRVISIHNIQNLNNTKVYLTLRSTAHYCKFRKL